MDEFQMEVIRLAMQKMFRPSSYFSICAVQECLAVAKIPPPSGILQDLHPLHCVHWGDMTPQFREEVFRRVMGMFSETPMTMEELDIPLIGGTAQGSSTLFQRLLGRTSADA